jgi:1-deoxy-D-xylulose-5-phosphate synthase
LAEEDPGAYHGVGSFELEVGVASGGKSFSSVFGESLCEIASKNEKVCAVTAAMSSGTGLDSFAKSYPDRFFDVGIAEEHALTFSAALATEGFIPYFAVYSTFAQRCYDQIIHDAALQNLHIVLCLDRAGFSAPDGATHHGVFDVSFLCGIPNVKLYAPESFADLGNTLKACESESGVCVIRYPKGGECGFPSDAIYGDGYKYKDFGDNASGKKCVIITYGRCATLASSAASELEGVFTRVVCVTKLKPFSVESIDGLLEGADVIYLPEEGVRSGGFAMQISAEIREKDLYKNAKIKIKAIDDSFVPHGTSADLYRFCGLDSNSMKEDISNLLN